MPRLVTDPKELEEILEFMGEAVKEALKSPCAKDKRGIIIVKGGKMIGKGHNRPPKGYKCCPEYCGDSCSVSAIHAEMSAMFTAMQRGYVLDGSRMYHARAQDGILMDSRKPRCPQCSKHLLDWGVEEFVLKHAEGYTIYSARELHDLGLENYRKREAEKR